MTKILVIAETQHHRVTAGTKSTINAALQLTPTIDLLLASVNEDETGQCASLEGVTTVWLATHPRFTHIVAEDLAPVIVGLSKDYTHIFAPATTFGKNLLPRVAAMLEVGQISDVTHIEDQETFVRPIYAGNAFEKVQSKDKIKIATLRTTAFEPVGESEATALIQPIPFPVVPFDKVHFKSEQTPELTRPELTSARIIISGGRGLKSAENFKMIEKIADKLGAAIGATRAAVDAGFVPNDLQVGQTGKIVAPELYIAVGISGAIQHIAGMKDSKIIVAINQDPDAPIFEVADYGLVGDLFTILPELESLLV